MKKKLRRNKTITQNAISLCDGLLAGSIDKNIFSPNPIFLGVFVADEWIAATTANFSGTLEDRPGRWGFNGSEATEQISKFYLRHRLPDRMRKRGAANPVKYAF